jgi:hypothetical protein
MRVMSLPEPLRDQDVERFAEHFIRRIAERLLRSMVEQGDRLGLIDADDGVRRQSHDPREMALIVSGARHLMLQAGLPFFPRHLIMPGMVRPDGSRPAVGSLIRIKDLAKATG